MEVAQQESFAAMRQKRIDQMAKMHHKISSPKLREMLKEKCIIRMKESRHHLHDGRRALGTAERRGFMQQILKEEILEFESDIEKQEQIYREMMEEADQWLYEEMEFVEERIIDQLLEVSDNFCPVCQKSNLISHRDSLITCDCGIKFVFSPGPQQLHESILRLVTDHEQACNTRLQFFAEPSSRDNNGYGLSSVNAYCANCEFYSVLVA